MFSETASPGYERLNQAVNALGLEISDAILTAIREDIQTCREEEKERLALVEPVLSGMEAVVTHIAAFRAASDARTFSLLKELMAVYRDVAWEISDQEKAQPVAFAALKTVLDWQHSCLKAKMESTSEPAVADQNEADTTGEGEALRGLLAAMRQEIAATGMMAVREAAALLELVHVQQGTAETGPAVSGDTNNVGAMIKENISSLQQIFHQELDQLRHEFGRPDIEQTDI
ncbi:MAG: hypothetical protein ACL93V_05880 [Candidatus Electrothrix sp. YB6]